jgi:hypothetical protein
MIQDQLHEERERLHRQPLLGSISIDTTSKAWYLPELSLIAK